MLSRGAPPEGRTWYRLRCPDRHTHRRRVRGKSMPLNTNPSPRGLSQLMAMCASSRACENWINLLKNLPVACEI